VVREGSASEPKYNIVLTKFEPEMFAGTYEASVLLGSHQVRPAPAARRRWRALTRSTLSP
jgi:hypothetical protein